MPDGLSARRLPAGTSAEGSGGPHPVRPPAKLPWHSSPRQRLPQANSCHAGAMQEPDLTRLLLEAHRGLAEELVANMAERGYPEARAGHAAVVLSIDRRAGTRLTELAQRARMSKQGMMLLVDDMEGRGYVRRVPDPADARAKIVRLTARGRTYVAETRRALQAVEGRDPSRARGPAVQAAPGHARVAGRRGGGGRVTERELRVFDDLDGLVDAAVSLFLEERPRTIALSGGSTPKPVYERLAEQDYPWAEVEVFFGAERCVPPEHPDSNFRMANEALLSKVTTRVHAMYDCDPALYEADLRSVFGDGVPAFDLKFMGI